MSSQRPEPSSDITSRSPRMRITLAFSLDRAKIAWQFQPRDLSPALQSRDWTDRSRVMQVCRFDRRSHATNSRGRGEGNETEPHFQYRLHLRGSSGTVRSPAHARLTRAPARECAWVHGTAITCATADITRDTCSSGLRMRAHVWTAFLVSRASVRRIYRAYTSRSMLTQVRYRCIALLRRIIRFGYLGKRHSHRKNDQIGSELEPDS